MYGTKLFTLPLLLWVLAGEFYVAVACFVPVDINTIAIKNIFMTLHHLPFPLIWFGEIGRAHV